MYNFPCWAAHHFCASLFMFLISLWISCQLELRPKDPSPKQAPAKTGSPSHTQWFIPSFLLFSCQQQSPIKTVAILCICVLTFEAADALHPRKVFLLVQFCDVANLCYRSDMNVENIKNPFIFWLPAGTCCSRANFFTKNLCMCENSST